MSSYSAIRCKIAARKEFNEHPGENGTELVLIYAWNEFDEGGWLVPALPPPHGEGAARLDALRRVLVTGKGP